MKTAEQIKEFIIRRASCYQSIADKNYGRMEHEYINARYDAYRELLKFIDSEDKL